MLVASAMWKGKWQAKQVMERWQPGGLQQDTGLSGLLPFHEESGSDLMYMVDELGPRATPSLCHVADRDADSYQRVECFGQEFWWMDLWISVLCFLADFFFYNFSLEPTKTPEGRSLVRFAS